jgi:hypothetical protein
MEVIHELPQEVASRQREAPGEMVVEDHRFPGLRSGHSFAAGRAATHQVRRRQHSALAQQLNPLLFHPGALPGSFRQICWGTVLDRGSALSLSLLPRSLGSHSGADLDERNGDRESLEP